jgi:hypothetical protein
MLPRSVVRDVETETVVSVEEGVGMSDESLRETLDEPIVLFPDGNSANQL